MLEDGIVFFSFRFCFRSFSLRNSFLLLISSEEGGESFTIYNGRYLASTTNTIVVVTNYRIGNLGFLYAPFVCDCYSHVFLFDD
jgi:hypothetical protein